jgi:hypothetical protein
MGSQTRQLSKLKNKASSTEKPETGSGLAGFLSIWDRVTNRLGPSGGLLLLIFFAVKSLAGDATEELIVQEIFFGKTTGKPYVGLFFAVLIAFTLVDASLVYQYVKAERREMKRLRAEVRRLQSQILELEPEEQERAS